MDKPIEYYMKLPYTKVLIKDADGSVFAKIEELTGCMTVGNNESDALEMLDEALCAWIQVAIETGKEIPEPKKRSDVMDDFKSVKIKIDEDGHLWIERAGKMKIQMCPHDTSDRDSLRTEPCGDWCPLFGNPHLVPNGQYLLALCSSGGKWFVDADCLEDQRGK